MAASKTTRNDTPNTPDVDESKIARMKVDDLRRELKAPGVKGTADLKKPELVKKMIKAATSSGSGKKTASASASGKKTASASASGRKTASASASGKKTASASASGKKSVSASAKKSTSASKNPTSRNDTPNTPGVDESKIARMKADDLRRELKARGVKGTADLKKPQLVKKYIATATSGSRSGSAASSSAKTGSSAAKSGKTAASSSAKTGSSAAKSGRNAASVSAKAGSSAAKSGKTAKSGTKGDGGKRTGKNTSSSLKYSQEIRSTSDRPERAGRSLVTTDHEVIRRWAAARNAVPATVEGTDHDGHLGVLRLNFPGYSGDRLTEVSWDDWFEAFDKRRLNFIFQEKQSGGKRSNFFQLENPDE